MKYLTFILCLFLSIQTFAQLDITKKADLEWGEELDIKRRQTLDSMVTTVDDKLYVLIDERNNKILQEYGTDLKYKRSVEIPLRIDREFYDFQNITYLNGRFIVFLSKFERREDKTDLYYTTVDREDLSTDMKLVHLGELQSKQAGLKKEQGSFDFDISEDESKILIFKHIPNADREPEKYSFQVFDSQLNQLWEDEVQLNYSEELFEVLDIRTTNSGDVFVMGKEFEDRKAKRKEDETQHTFHLLKYNSGGNKAKDFEIEVGEKFVTDIQFAVRDNEDIIVSGFYSTVDNTMINGTFFITIDGETQKVKTSSLKAFDEDFITEGMTLREEKKAKRKAERKDEDLGLSNFDIREFIIYPDGSIKILAEQYFETTVTSTSSGADGMVTTTSYTQFNYENIIIISVNADGDIEWNALVEKEQIAVVPGGRFLHVMPKENGDIRLFYNLEMDDYLDRGQMGDLKRKARRGDVTLYTIVNDNGELKEKVLFETEDMDIVTVDALSDPNDENTMILYTIENDRDKSFAKVSFR
ncbi:hypothetical protein [Halocola ammonii]